MKKIIITTSILLSSLMLIIIYQLSQLPLQLPQPNDIGKYQISITSEIIDGEVYVYELKINTETGDTYRDLRHVSHYEGKAVNISRNPELRKHIDIKVWNEVPKPVKRQWID